MATITVREAETDFRRVLERVMGGEDVIIAQDGHPVARVTRIGPAPSRRQPGTARGKITLSPDFDAPLPKDVLDACDQ